MRHSSSDAKMNEAIEEAILIARHEGQLLDTIHLWQNRETVVLTRNADVATTVNDHELERNGVSIVRRAGAGRNMYHDRGTLNLTYAIDHKGLFPDDPPLSDVYKGLCQPVSEAILALGLDNRTDDYGQRIVTKGGTISQTSVAFYYDFILFQISLNVCTNLALSRQLLKHADAPTSLSNELNRHVRPEEIEGTLLNALSRRFGIELEEQSLSQTENQIAEKLSKLKYSTKEWNFQGKAPLTLKQLLIELYVAYPPTTSCRELIMNTQATTADLLDKVEVRIWMRNEGLDGQGWPSGVIVSPALERAAKQSLIPSVVINGRLACSRIVPSRTEMRSWILSALGKS